MRVAFDMDHTITAYPQFFSELFHAWWERTGDAPYIITARRPSDYELTIKELLSLGFKFEEKLREILHVYTKDYVYPCKSRDDEKFLMSQMARWKVEKCKELLVTVLIDDSAENVLSCSRNGIFVLQAFPVMRPVKS